MKSPSHIWLAAMLVLGLPAATGCLPLGGGDEFASVRPKTIAYFNIQREGRSAGFLKVIASGGALEIWEKLSMPYRRGDGEIFSYHTVVRYKMTPACVPTEARATTRVGGHMIMEGKIIFGEKTFSVSATDRWDPKTGKAIEPAKTIELKDRPIPEGVLLFQSAFTILGPKLLKEPGEMEIVFVEFPGDLTGGELYNMKKGYRLIREAPKEDGSFSINVSSGSGDKPVMLAEYDAAGKCTSAGSGPSKYIPASSFPR